MQRKRRYTKRAPGSALVEAMACFFVFIPLALIAMDLAVLYHAAQVNEEFAEQLARLCSTLTNKPNAVRACQEVIKQYKHPSNISDVSLTSLDFDLSLEEVYIATSMSVALPFPFPGYERRTLLAKVKQPILSLPSPP